MINNKPCLGCEDNHSSYSPPPFVQPCSQVPGTCNPVDASCTFYNGPNLTCTEIETGKDLDFILQKIDEKLCSIEGGDWSTFDYNCLTEDVTIETAAEFAYQMSLQFCNLKETYTTFVEETHPQDLQNLQDQIDSILHPQLTLCAQTGIVADDAYTTIIEKLANTVCTVILGSDMSLVNWSQCFTVPTIPTSIVEGFNLLIDQICTVKDAAGGGSQLPTFNNVGSCLPSPGSADSLAATIAKIKTRLCQSVTYDKSSSVWTCISEPATFQAVIDAILVNVQNLMALRPVFDTNIFALTPNGCNGVGITLLDDVAGTDRFVASDASDTAPGTLADKLEAGDNITLSNTEVPGKIVIHADVDNDNVKTNAGDASTGYLQDKIVGSTTNGVTVTATPLVDNSKVKIEASLNFDIITNEWFDRVESDPDLYARFCTLICGCKPCNEPGTPPPTIVKRVRLRVVNTSPSQTYANTYTLFQNSPVLGWMDNTVTVGPSQTYESGWYDVTSTTPSLVSTLKVVDANGTPKAQTLNIRVLQPGNSVIPGTSSFVGSLGGGFTNTSFNLGNLTTDMTVEIRLS